MEVATLTTLLKEGGVAGFLVVVVVLVVVGGLGILLRNKSVMTIQDKDRLVDTSQLSSISTKLDSIDRRLTTVEKDVAARATAEEVHRMELAFTKMEGRIDTMTSTGAATKEAVTRIENFMYEAALRARGS